MKFAKLSLYFLIIYNLISTYNCQDLKALRERIRRQVERRLSERSLDSMSGYGGSVASEVSESNGRSEEGGNGGYNDRTNGMPRMSTGNSKQKASSIAIKAAQEAKVIKKLLGKICMKIFHG